MNKPVNCRCGGEAEIVFDGNGEMSGVAVKCKKCGITTAYYLDDTQKAIQAWNRAMGERTAKVEHKSNTYIVTPSKSTTIFYETRTNLWKECGNCHTMGIYHGWNYCPKCGVKLDWSENE